MRPSLSLWRAEKRKELRGLVESSVQQELQEEAEANKLNFVDDDDDRADKEEEFEKWKVRPRVQLRV